MGIGTTSIPPTQAKEWNSGSCDVMAVALHRMYGLPMMAEFEWGMDGGRAVLGYLMHAWVELPDGRALDAAGPRAMFAPQDGGDPDDPWVAGYRIVRLSDRNPHLLDTREEKNYVEAIRDMEAPQWIMAHLGPALAALGLEPVRYRNLVGLPPLNKPRTRGHAAPPTPEDAPAGPCP